jgi:hypothetical protein
MVKRNQKAVKGFSNGIGSFASIKLKHSLETFFLSTTSKEDTVDKP